MRSGCGRVPNQARGSRTCVAWDGRRELGNCPALLSSQVPQRTDPGPARLFSCLDPSYPEQRGSPAGRSHGATPWRERGAAGALPPITCDARGRGAPAPALLEYGGQGSPRATRTRLVAALSEQRCSPRASRESCSPGNGPRHDFKRPQSMIWESFSIALSAISFPIGDPIQRGQERTTERRWNLCGCPTL